MSNRPFRSARLRLILRRMRFVRVATTSGEMCTVTTRHRFTLPFDKVLDDFRPVGWVVVVALTCDLFGDVTPQSFLGEAFRVMVVALL